VGNESLWKLTRVTLETK